MALKGNLSDFSLPDVFSLIQLSRKTGVLRIAREGSEGSIWFRDGEVFFATSDWRRELLGQRLVSEGTITPNALERALSLRRAEPADGRRLGTILVDEGYLVHATLETFVQEQIQDTIFDLMRWDDGAFGFEPLDEIPTDEDIGLSVSVENIVMEGSRRLDEWNRIRRKIPSMDMVFRMSTAPGQGTFEISLKPAEWKLLLALDGARSVSDLAEATGRTDFEVARSLYGLHSAGLLELAGDDDVEAARALRDARATRLETAHRSRARASAQRPAAAVSTGSSVASEEPAFLTAPAASAADPIADFGDLISAPVDMAEPGEEPVPLAEPVRDEPAPPPPAALTEFLDVPVETSEPFDEAVLDEPAPPAPHTETVEPLVPGEAAPTEPVADEPAPPPPSAEFADLISAEPELAAAPASPEGPGPEPPVEAGVAQVAAQPDAAPLVDDTYLAAQEPRSAAPVEPVADEAVAPFEPEPGPLAVEWEAAAAQTGEAPLPEPEPEPVSDQVAALLTAVVAPEAQATPLEEAPEPEPEPEATPEHGLAGAMESPVADPEPVPEPAAAGLLDDDIFGDEFGLGDGGALGDELTALTGAQRRLGSPGTHKPTAQPDKPLKRIHRDTRVDRETVQRIIEGLEQL